MKLTLPTGQQVLQLHNPILRPLLGLLLIATDTVESLGSRLAEMEINMQEAY